MQNLRHWILLFATLVVGLSAAAQEASMVLPETNARPVVLVVTAHPDDWEGIAGGTLTQLSATHDVHVAIASRGERGIREGDEDWADVVPSATTARIRTAEAETAAARIGAKLYWLGSIDGEVYPDKQRIDSVAALMLRLQPSMIFTMWGADVPDHAAAGHMALRAAWQTGLIHSAEFYYGEAQHGGQTQQFTPDVYVNIDSFAEAKLDLLRDHPSQNINDGLIAVASNAISMHGLLARCTYAEPFKTYFPLVGRRFNRAAGATLLTLGSDAEESAAASETRPRLLVVGTHPGDWEDGCGGTVWRMRETHDITVVCVTRGERGAGGDAPLIVGPAREREAIATAAALDATLYFLGEPDAAAQAGPATVDSMVRILEAIDPDVVLTMWPLDVADHAAASAITTQAMHRTQHLYSAELYFYESDAGHQTVSFAPKLYVNIDAEIEDKRRLLRLHATENPGDILDANMMAKAKFRGESARCSYAEGFIPYFPLNSQRWGRSGEVSLW